MIYLEKVKKVEKYYKNVGRLGEEHNNIEKRPKEANERLELGHWEGDTVVSSKNKYCIVTVVDRTSRFLLSKVIPNRKADTVAKAIIHLLRGQHVKSVTFDNGREFADYQKIEKDLILLPILHIHMPRGKEALTKIPMNY